MKKPKILLIGMLVVMGVQVHASPQEGWIEVTSTGAEFKYVGHDDALGDLWEAPNKVIWTEVAKRPDGTTHFMNTVDAGNYCKSHEAVLPSQEDYEKYRRFNGYGTDKGYNSPFFAESGRFATSSVVPKHPERAIFFYETTNTGEFGNGDLHKYLHSVRCLKTIRLLRSDDPRVTPAFAALGNMYQVGDVIWSGVARQKMNKRNAEQFCQNLGEGSFLPSRENYEALRVAMGYPNNYNPNLLPDMARNWFWSSSVSNDGYIAYKFFGGNGSGAGDPHHNKGSVRCARVAEPRGN